MCSSYWTVGKTVCRRKLFYFVSILENRGRSRNHHYPPTKPHGNCWSLPLLMLADKTYIKIVYRSFVNFLFSIGKFSIIGPNLTNIKDSEKHTQTHTYIHTQYKNTKNTQKIHAHTQYTNTIIHTNNTKNTQYTQKSGYQCMPWLWSWSWWSDFKVLF